MKTVDTALLEIADRFKEIQHALPKKDKRILVSLTKQLQNQVFLTENQSNLLKKILQENLQTLNLVFQKLEETIILNLWSKPFRVTNKVKKIYNDPNNSSKFVVEFNFNTRLKDKISKLCNVIQGQTATSGTKYIFLLNEINVYHIVNEFVNENFEIDRVIMELFKEIKKIKEDTQNPFDINNDENKKIRKVVEDHVAPIDPLHVLKLQDHKIRHQYQFFEKIPEISLAVKIAQRQQRKVYLSSDSFLLVDLISSLKELDRFPILFIFDGRDPKKDIKNLKSLENAVSTLGIGQDIGIYFRYDKQEDTAHFNEEISVLGYNKNLDSSTMIVGVSNSKLPKFIIKQQWKPKSVVSFTNGFSANKASVYCADVDLVVYYTGSKPLNENIHELV